LQIPSMNHHGFIPEVMADCCVSFRAERDAKQDESGAEREWQAADMQVYLSCILVYSHWDQVLGERKSVAMGRVLMHEPAVGLCKMMKLGGWDPR